MHAQTVYTRPFLLPSKGLGTRLLLYMVTFDSHNYVTSTTTKVSTDITSDMQAMMWGEPDLTGTAVDLGNDAEFGIFNSYKWMFS